MTEIRVRRRDDASLDTVAIDNPFPVSIEAVNAVESEPYIVPYFEIPGIGTATVYSSGDAFGTKFRIAVPHLGKIETVIMLDLDDEGIETEIWLFSEDFTQTADNSAMALSDADLIHLEAVISVVNFANLSSNQVGIANNLGLAYSAPSKHLYGQCVTRGAPNIAAANIPMLGLRIMASKVGE